MRSGKPIVGYGFSSIGRFAQGGLIRERFIPRILGAAAFELLDASGMNFDPFRIWDVMMRGEKPGGHGERCVAVGTLDMAIWDLAAKIADEPLNEFLSKRFNRTADTTIKVYAGGGYYYPTDDIGKLTEEARRLETAGYSRFKIKIGAKTIAEDRQRIEAVTAIFDPENIAVDAMNTYSKDEALNAATAFERLGLWWFEDICDPLDFALQAHIASIYPNPIAAGEALFSDAEARLLDSHGGLRKDRDVLLFDPVHCYGLPGFVRIIETMERRGWSRSSFWPHGGHIFSAHLVSALGLGGAEVNALCFAPFGGLIDPAAPSAGQIDIPQAIGVGFEQKRDLFQLFQSL
jgi:L-alanine-DL-glutamate epimerase-like enolase superfamily enzyme